MTELTLEKAPDTNVRHDYRTSVLPVRTASGLTRISAAIVLAMLLAVRLLAPAGFMPSFERGAVTIVACHDTYDDTKAAAPMHHGHGGQDHTHEQCPYASASPVAASDFHSHDLIAFLIFASALLLGGALLFTARKNVRTRPPTTGPPISA